MGRARAAVIIGIVILALSVTILTGNLVSLLFAAPFMVGPYVVTGGILAIQRPHNIIGWLLIATGWTLCFGMFVLVLDPAALQAGTASAAARLMAWCSGWAWSGLITCLVAIAAVFPSGHLPRGRWGPAAAAMIAFGTLLTAITAFAPTIAIGSSVGPAVEATNPLAIAPDSAIWGLLPRGGTLYAIQVSLLALSALRIVSRYRVSEGLERLQLTWLVAALVFAAIALPISLVLVSSSSVAAGDVRDPAALLPWTPVLTAVAVVPIAIGFAVMRYRLYEIDRIVSRGVAWGLVTAFLVGLFVVLVVGLQALLAPLTNGSTLAVAASTLLVAAVFQPFRRRIQSAVDRRFDRARYDAVIVVEGFAEHLRDELDLDTLGADIARVARETVRPTSAAVWLRSRSDPSA